MKGKEFVEKLMHEFKCDNIAQLAEILGVTNPTIYSWNKSKNLSPMVVARAIRKLTEKLEGDSEEMRSRLRSHQIAQSISTLVEYAPISASHKSGTQRVQIKSSDGFGHLRIRNTLEDKRGIYIFYSSMCRPLYVGKAKGTELWGESNVAFNKDYKSDFYKINYPSENQKRNKDPRLTKNSVKLYEVATYFSAYEVDGALVDTIEALMIRSFINELSNIKVESLPAIKHRNQ